MKPSEALSKILSANIEENEGVAYLETLSENPFIAVGFAPASRLHLVLLLPKGTLSADVNLERIECRQAANIKARFGNAKDTHLIADILFFDDLTPAVEVVLDALVSEIHSETTLAGELAKDFIDLFRPKRGLSAEQILGLFGELVVILEASDAIKAVGCWHEQAEGRYDFTAGNSRLEIKTTLLQSRQHQFSSSQIPPKNGIHLVVGSIMTEQVQDGTSILDLWTAISHKLNGNPLLGKFNKQVLALVKLDPDSVSEITFDYDAAVLSLSFYDGSMVPAPVYGSGVSKVSWEASLNELTPVTPLLAGVNETIIDICFKDSLIAED